MPFRPTLILLMHDLCQKYGKQFTDLCMDGDKISRRVNILVNGHHMLHLEQDNTQLKDNDDVRIFPVIAAADHCLVVQRFADMPNPAVSV